MHDIIQLDYHESMSSLFVKYPL